jgi:penicillin-insensitive murein endopeptidase
MGFRHLIGVALAVVCMTGPASAEKLAKQYFGAKRDGSNQTAAAYGSYAKGCGAGLVQMPESGPTWQSMRLSRNRNWGHPELIDFGQKLSRVAVKQGWKGLYFGDFSQPRGGPMLTGHRSHQLGLDADIWMNPVGRVNLNRNQRENISAISMRRAGGAFVNDKWTRAHHEILKAAASDPRVARIFVFPGAKVQMCKDEKARSKRKRAWLRKIRPWWGHHYHFHVRLSCPKGSRGCVNQDPPPAGDGCADAQKWVDNILNPPAPPKNPPKTTAKKRRELRLTDLPKACVGVLNSN